MRDRVNVGKATIKVYLDNGNSFVKVVQGMRDYDWVQTSKSAAVIEVRDWAKHGVVFENDYKAHPWHRVTAVIVDYDDYFVEED